MMIEKFEDVIAWKKSKELVMNIYKQFNQCRDYSYKDQIQRAAISIMNNIAEGFERRTNKELINFLYIAKGSSGEVRSMLYLARELNYITDIENEKLMISCVEISRILAGFIKSLKI